MSHGVWYEEGREGGVQGRQVRSCEEGPCEEGQEVGRKARRASRFAAGQPEAGQFDFQRESRTDEDAGTYW